MILIILELLTNGCMRREDVMKDIFFKTEDYIFSYRVAGILIHNGKIILQRPVNGTGYAFPGGHDQLW